MEADETREENDIFCRNLALLDEEGSRRATDSGDGYGRVVEAA
jgi:hypothetical protein